MSVHEFEGPERRAAFRRADDREVHAPQRVKWDGTISLNTLVMCVTLVGGFVAATDRLAEARAESAVLREKILQLGLADADMRATRERDRAEARGELAEISRKLDRLLDPMGPRLPR